MLPSIFTVANEHLGRLEPAPAIRFFSELLWAEARRLGLPATNVSISSRINAPDGGVDASVTSTLPFERRTSRRRRPCYQVKTGDFKPLQEGAIRKELFGQGQPASRDSLSEHLRQCLDKGQRSVLVCTGISLTDEERTTAIGGILAALTDAGYDSPRVGVFSQDQLIGCLAPYPSLCLALNGHSNAQFQTFRSWASNDQMQKDFEGRRRAGWTMRERFERESATTSALSTFESRGEPGIGKTRLALEAASEHDIWYATVFYCDGPHNLRDSGLLQRDLEGRQPIRNATGG